MEGEPKPSTGPEPVQAALMPFDARGELAWAIPFGWTEYAELVDWTGRQVRPDKRGHIDATQPAILARLGLEGEAFVDMACHLLERFGVAVGRRRQWRGCAPERSGAFLHGQRVARKMSAQ